MDSRLDDRLTSAILVKRVFNQNRSIVETIPALLQVATDLEAKISIIQDTRKIAETNYKGIVDEKSNCAVLLSEKAREIASAVYALAVDTNNNLLKTRVDYSPSDFQYVRESLLLDRAKIVYDAASENIAALAAYGVTSNDLADLKGRIEDFEDLISAPRDKRSDRKTANKNLKTYFKELEHILGERADNIMETQKTKQPAFYQAYRNARNVINMGVRHEDEDKDGETGTENADK